MRMYDQFDQGHDDLREQLMAVLPPEPDRSRADWLACGWQRLGDLAVSLNRRVSGRAAAAVFAVAASLALGVFLFVSAERQKAFAAAIEHFQRAKTIVCRLSSPATMGFGGMEISLTGTLYISAEHGSRFESYGNGFLANIYYTPLEGPVTVVNPPAGNYIVIDRVNVSQSAREGSSPDEFICALQKLGVEADRELGQMEIDGVEALGYEISGETLGLGAVPDARSELWIDANTDLPLRYVAETPGFEPGTKLTLVYDQFEWDTPLEPELFEPDIPPGYARLEATMPAVDETTMIDGLGQFAELAGKYPTEMSMPKVVGELASAIASRVAGGEATDRQALAQRSIEIGAACAFYQKLAREGRSPEYHGDTVSPGQADAVLARWKLTDGTWRVVYGDLQVKNLSSP
jgi:hypothetical protein